MRKVLRCVVLVGVLLILTGCSASLPAGDSGSVALIPFFDMDAGISGVVPATCSQSSQGNFDCPDQSAVVQQAYPGPLDELVDLVLAQTSLERLPEPTGSYRGRAFDWDLYSLVAQVEGAGPDAMRVELGLAEQGSVSYIVALVTSPEAYSANPARFDTIFTHVMYGLMPWEG
jgi:hypothetical protein